MCVEVWSIVLPGKYNRLQEPPLLSFAPAVEKIAMELAPWMDRPYALFGHSLGALLNFEVARLTQQAVGPMHLFVSGMEAPHRRMPEEPLHTLTEEGLIAELRRLNGTPEEILMNREMLAHILPLLRADFSIYDSYQFCDGAKLRCPISVYGGRQDKYLPAQLESWRDLTDASFNLTWFNGDHFFILNETRALLTHLGSVLDHCR